MKKALIIQGGGFRTAFSSGVLDAFIRENYFPFDIFAGVSGGAIALSYYLSGQEKYCYEAICFLSANKNFLNPVKAFSQKGMMNVEIFNDIATLHFPFDYEHAFAYLENKIMAIVMTHRKLGKPVYYHPDRNS